jgi:lipopolysaccharide/colanic/teichoic acid biosynthesis glycosyltransferase
MGYSMNSNKVEKDWRGSLENVKSAEISVSTEEERVFEWPISAYINFKGVLDRICALSFIILLSPFMACIALAIRLDSPGHPIFSQERLGKKGRKFIAYKFRTMYINNDDSRYKAYIKEYIQKNAPYKTNPNGERVYKLVDDPRITHVGALLRKSNLDELPQLFNMVKGEMALIGPRPDLPFSADLYSAWHRKRLDVRPGITGLWQVCHRKGLCFDDMVQLDLEYIEKQTPFLDIKIILMTIQTILTWDGS